MVKNKYIFAFIVIWIIVIFMFSNGDFYESNGLSMQIIYNFLLFTNKLHITSIDSADMEYVIEVINVPFRKLAHMIEYFVLALLVFNLLKNHKLGIKKYYFTIIICFGYALIDEYHQTFISGRTGQLSDCFIDILGSLIYLLLVYKISRRNLKI